METERGQTSVPFILLALAILGLICIGLMGLGAALYLRNASQQQQEVAQQPLPTPIPTFTQTPTVTPIPPTPTNTPEPTPTATLVVNAQSAAVEATGQTGGITQVATATPMNLAEVAPPTPIATVMPAQIPQGGGVLAADNNILVWAGLGVLGLLIAGLINYLRGPVFPK